MNCQKQNNTKLGKVEKNEVKKHNEKLISSAKKNADETAPMLTVLWSKGGWGLDIVKKERLEAREIENRNTVPTVLPVSTEFAKSADSKRNSRQQYAERQKKTLPTGAKHIDEVSPLLDIVATPAMTLLERLEVYSKTHKCLHKKSYNQYSFEKSRFMKPSCDHRYESVGELANETCMRCRAKAVHNTYRVCGHKGLYCARCRFTFYLGDEGKFTPLACSCKQELERIRIEDELKVPIMDFDGQYDHRLKENSIETFLNNTTRSKPTDRGTYTSVVAKKSIVQFLKEEEKPDLEGSLSIPEDEFPKLGILEEAKVRPVRFRRSFRAVLRAQLQPSSPIEVIPEGGQVSALASRAKNVIGNISEPIIGALKSTIEALKTWLLSLKPKCVSEFESVAKFGVLVMRLLSSILNALLKKSPMELALWISCAVGSKAQMCLAFSTLIVDAINEFLDTSVWCSGILKVLTDSVDDSIRKWRTDSGKKKIIDIDSKIRLMYKHYYAAALVVDEVKERPPYTLQRMEEWLTATPASNERTNVKLHYDRLCELDLAEVERRMEIISVEVQQEGLSDILQACIMMLPSEFHLSSLKSVTLFCKDILPVILVAKNIAEFSGKIYTWIMTLFGYHTTDTRTWLNLEFQKEDSPVKKGALSAFDYKLMANCDHPQAGLKLAEAKRFRDEMADYIKAENRFDQHSIKFMSEVDKLISTTSLPPMARKHEPFCVRLYGPPGSGKSTSVPVLFGPILGVKTVDEFYQKSFSRNMSEYWDGVGNRQCILYDDFGQNRTEPVDLMELILLISAAPFMANFANITGSTPKGMSIDPKLVVASSNMNKDYTSALSDNGAVFRRFHLRVHVVKENGEVRMRVDGGSLTDENENILPKTGWMSVEKMQEYIYFAYEQFTISRTEGDNRLQASLMNSPPGESLLTYDVTGKATARVVHNKETIREYFAKHNVSLPLAVPTGLSNREIIQDKIIKSSCTNIFSRETSPASVFKPIEVANESGLMSWSHLFDIWKDQASAHYLALCYGSVFGAAFSFVNGFPKTTTFTKIALAALLPAVTSLCVALYLWSRIREVEPESSTAKGKAAPRMVAPESGSTAVADVQSVLDKATCRLITSDGLTVVNAVLIGGTSLLTVEHAFIPPVREKISSDLYFAEGKEFKLYIPNVANPVEFTFERSRLRPITKIIEGKKIEVDAVIYELPRNLIPMRRRIITRFWKGEILLKNKKSYLLDHQDRNRTPVWKESTLNAEEQVFYVQNGKKWLQHLVHGSHISGPGSCGSPVMLATGETNASIVGIHVAKHPSGTPMILVLTQEMIERSMPDARILDPPIIETSHTTEEVKQESALLQDTCLLHLGETRRKMFLSTTTTLRPSLLHQVIQPALTEPAVLHPKDPRISEDLIGKVDLYRDGVDKMKKPIRLTFEDLTSVRNDMIDWYLQKFAEYGHKIGSPLSMRRVFNGDDVLNGVDLTTSCGYPFTFEGVDKSQLMIREPSQTIVGTAKFYEQLLKDLLSIMSNTIPQWFVTGNLKDERRPIEKVRIRPKTRLFTVCPVIMICLEKMYFGHFMRCLLTTKDVPYVGGMDRLGRDWHDMFAQLRVVSDRGFGGDYQCYDGSLSEGLISSALSIMEATLDPKTLDDWFHIRPSETDGSIEALHIVKDINELKIKHSEILSAVKQALVNPVYLLKDQVFQTVGTLTSGCWTTQLVGTLSNELMLRAAWNDLVPRHVRGGYFYKKYVENKIMSDDNINSVERSLLPVYNGVTYSGWLREKGMVYTSAKKNGDAAAVEPLETISFLKNTTGLLKGFYCPLMDQESAIEISNWIRKSKYVTEFEATEMNANSTLRAMFYHGEPNFTFIRNAFLDKVPSLHLVDYNTLLHQFLNYGCFPGTQFEAYNFAEEMNIMPREPNLLPLPTQQEVECSSSIDTTLDRSRKESIIETDDITNMIEVKQEGKELNYQCEFCDAMLVSRNRLVDHMVANHQEREVDYVTTLEFFQNSSQAVFKDYYTELMKPNPGAKAQALVDLAAKESISKTVLITTLNNMLSYVAGRLDNRKALNTNAGALDMQSIFISKGMPKRKINLDSLLASISDVVKTELEEGYTIVEAKQESGSMATNTPAPEDMDITFGFGDEDGGAETTGGGIETEAPLVTSVQTDIKIKDPVDEARTVDNQEGTILTDKGQIDMVKVKTTGFAAPRAQSTLNDQSWNLEKMLQKWHPVKDVKWSVSDSTGTVLFTADVLKDIIKSGFAGTAFTVFKDFRCAGVRIKAVMVGSKWHQGRALMGFSPSMVPSAAGAYPRVWSNSDAILTGAAKFDPSVGGTTEYYIPFRHAKTYLTLEEDDTLGQLLITVLSPLKVSSSASQEVTIKLFFCIDQPMFKIPRATPITFRMLSELGRRIGNQLPSAKAQASFVPVEVKQESGGQPPINSYPVEGSYISAQRAKTGDPKTKQFGETDPNLINHCKRYRKVRETIKSTMAATIEWETIDIYDIIKVFWPLWLFNGFRGAINLKIFVAYTTGASQPNKGFAELFFEPRPNDQVPANDLKYKQAFAAAGSTIDPFRSLTRGEQGCIEVQIPFVHRSGIALNPFFFKDSVQSTAPYLWAGRLYLRHAPATGAGPNYRSTWIYASLSDEFGMGIFRGVPFCRMNSSYPGFVSPARVTQEGILDGLVSKGLDAIKEQVVPEKIISNVLSCLDKPAIATVPEFVTSKDSGFMNFSSGPEPLDKLAMHPACQQIVDAEHFGTSENEANLVSLFKRPNLLGSFTWKSSNESQELLTSFKVHPMLEFDAGVPSGDFRPLLLTYLSSKFKYWRGGLTFIFEVVGTNFQEGRLDFTFHPNTSIVPGDYETRMSQYSMSCSLKNTENRYAITVPYLAEEPFRRVWNGEEYNEPSATASPPACTEFHSGMLGVSVGARLGLPDNVPADVEVLVYILPASDFELNTVSVDKRSLVEAPEV